MQSHEIVRQERKILSRKVGKLGAISFTGSMVIAALGGGISSAAQPNKTSHNQTKTIEHSAHPNHHKKHPKKHGHIAVKSAVMSSSEATLVAQAEQKYPGDQLLILPADLCNEIVVIKPMNTTDVANVGESSTSSPIDQLVPDAQPQADCASTTEHAAAMESSGQPLYKPRGEWSNANYTGTANRWEPLAGAWPNSPSPGNPGNVVIFGHRTTESAPFSSIDQLKTGDVLINVMPDKQVFNYTVNQAPIPYDSTNNTGVLDYDYNSSLTAATGSGETLFACNPQRAENQRIVVRSQLSGSYSS